MKKLLFISKTLLCAILLCAGATNAWGESFTEPTDNGDGTYTLNGITYTKTTYDFTSTTPVKGSAYSLETNTQTSLGGYTDAFSVTRYKIGISAGATVSDIHSGLSYTPNSGSKAQYIYYITGYGLQSDGTISLSVTNQSSSTLAVLHYTTGDGSTTIAGGTSNTSGQYGPSISFSLGNKNNSPYYLYTSLDVYEEFVGDFYSGADGYYYKKDDLESKSVPYTRKTFDFTTCYKGEWKSTTGSLSGFSENSSTLDRYETEIAAGYSNAVRPEGLTYTNNNSGTAYLQYFGGCGMQASTYGYTLGLSDAASSAVSYLYYKQGDSGNTNSVASVSETREDIAGTGTATIYIKNDATNPYRLYTRLEAFQKEVSVTVSDAGFATYVNYSTNLNFTSTGIKAYTVNVASQGVATLTQINKVQAGTPVLLYYSGGTTEAIPVCADYDTPGTNNLVAGTGATVATSQTVDEVDYTNMILNNVSGIGFYLAAGHTVAANRAYLHIESSLAPAASRMSLVFGDDETTGISFNNRETITNNRYYNLNGQRVEKPAKGLYIVNGKKVILK